MLKLSHADLAFMERRRARAAIGLFGLPLLLVLIVAGWGALYVWAPELVNPLHAGERFAIYNGEVCPAARQAQYVAVFVNVAVGLVAALNVSAIAFAFVERRYRKLVDRLAEAPSALPTAPATPAARV
jgi:ABC-type sulfate transport system permease component